MVKFLSFITITIISCAVNAQNIEDLELYEKSIKPGTQLTYQVSIDKKKYELVVTITKTGEEFAFNWQSGQPDNQSGSISISANALNKAAALTADLKPGKAAWEDQTAMILSRNLFKDIAANSQAAIKLNGPADTATSMSNAITEFNFDLNGQLVTISQWELQGGPENHYTVGILESQKFPLVCKVELGWSLLLTKIKTS